MNATSIFSGETEPGGEHDTFLLAAWFRIPVFDEGPGFQVFTLAADDFGVFDFDLAFGQGIITLETSCMDRAPGTGGSAVFTGGTAELDDLPDHPYIQDGWNSIALSCRFSTQTLQYMVNRQLLDSHVSWVDPVRSITLAAGSGFGLGNVRMPPGFALSDYRLNFGEEFFDLAVEANINKLFAAGNHPIFWGDRGELVTGQVPKVYLHGDTSEYLTNLGTAGPFSAAETIPLVNYIPGPA